MRTIPDLIKMEFRLANSQMARLSRDVAELKEGFAKLRDLPAQVEAMPRVVAGLVVEMLAEHNKKT